MENYKIFRDPIYTFISFNKETEQVILDIINTPIFQRLRRIKQLGFSEFTYPGATHTRFAHSIGVSYLIGEICNYISIPDDINLKVIVNDKECDVNIDKRQLKLILQLAGLLHDIGHGPFSHAFEKLLNDDYSHEEMTVKIIEKSEISDLISNCELFKNDLQNVAVKIIISIIKGEINKGNYWLKELISSQVDADRMDFLLRDAYMCGVPYGLFDLKWLIRHLRLLNIPQEDGRLGIVIDGTKGIYTVEAFIISRYHMYEQVYFHKTTRAFECVLEKLFLRLKELIEEVEDLFVDEYLISFIKNPDDLNSFLKLDDNYFWFYLNYWIRSKDSIIKELSKTIIHRIPPKLKKEIILPQDFSGPEYREFFEKWKRKIGENNIKYFLYEDDYKNVPYKDSYLLGESSPEKAERIWTIKDNRVIDVAEHSSLLKTIKNVPLKRIRLYIHRNFG